MISTCSHYTHYSRSHNSGFLLRALDLEKEMLVIYVLFHVWDNEWMAQSEDPWFVRTIHGLSKSILVTLHLLNPRIEQAILGLSRQCMDCPLKA